MTRTSKLKLGGFVAAMLGGLAGLVVLFGGAPRLFDNRARYVVLFTEAPGVNAGTPVRKSGVRVGEVTAIDLDPATGKVHVIIAVERKHLPRVNEEATIFRALFTNDTSVDFVPKTTPEGVPVATFGEVVPPNTEIAGITPINANQVIRQASAVLPSAAESMDKLLRSLQTFERSLPKVERAFDDFGAFSRSGRDLLEDPNNGIRPTLAEIRDFAKTAKPLAEDFRRMLKVNEEDIYRTVRAVRETSEGVSSLLNEENRKALSASIRNLQGSTDELTKTIRVANVAFDQADKAFASLASASKTVDQAAKPIAKDSEALMKNVSTAAEEMSRTLTDIRRATSSLNRTDGTFHKLLADPSLFNTLNDSAASLHRTLSRAEKIAQDLQVFSDKIARRPEVIGVGGALRPSAGLKESPGSANGPCLPPSPLDVPSYKIADPIPPTPLSDLPPQ
jgi:phospholipid/cholesterol/gamma-HCH transport system substrate-binding protein